MDGETISKKKIQEESDSHQLREAETKKDWETSPIKILETIFRIYTDTTITFAEEIKCIWDEEKGTFSVYSETRRETGGSSTTG